MKNLKLVNQTKNCTLAEMTVIADTFWSRSKGLLGRKSMSANETLWIKGSQLIPCNSIHTWFMNFPIDVAFVDSSLVVRAIYFNLPPWRMTWPTKGATSVFEFHSGSLQNSPIEIGDQLYVGD